MADALSAGPSDIQVANNAYEKRRITEWKWQLGLRIFLLVSLLVDLALVAYCVSVSNRDFGYDDGYWWYMSQTEYLFIPIGLSLLWMLVYLPLSFIKKTGFHPGFAVGFDLVLWLVLVAVAILYLMAGVFDYVNYDVNVSKYDPYQYVGFHTPGQQGEPVENGTHYTNTVTGDPYVYQSYDGKSSTRTNASIDYYCPYYNSCEDQTHFYNLINTLSHTALAASAVLLLCGLWHLALWIWACVDCARWNRRRSAGDDYTRAKVIAEEMVNNMQKQDNVTIVQHQQPEPAVSDPTRIDHEAEEERSSSSHPATLPQKQVFSVGKGKAALQSNEPRFH